MRAVFKTAIKIGKYDWYLSPKYDPGSSGKVREIYRSPLDLDITDNLDRFSFGIEGIIHLQRHVDSAMSPGEQVKRGLKKGRVIELAKTDFNTKRINYLKSQVIKSKKSYLQYIYPQNLTTNSRIIGHIGPDRELNAAIIIAPVTEETWYIEQILRHPMAPNGSMEAIIDFVIKMLYKEGYAFLSMGEVPFLKMKKSRNIEKFISWFGNNVLGPVYNFQGLYQFKNKFSPEWIPTYIYGNPGISLLVLWKLFFKSKMYRLAARGIMYQVKNKVSFFSFPAYRGIFYKSHKY